MRGVFLGGARRLLQRAWAVASRPYGERLDERVRMFRPRRRRERCHAPVAAWVQVLETRVLLSAGPVSDAEPVAVEQAQAVALTQITGSFTQGGSTFAAKINSVGPNGIDSARNTWILIHGWNSNPVVWATAMGESLAARFPDDTILTFDWSAASNTGALRPDLSESRIQPAAAWLAEQLVLNGFAAAQLNFVGHSHGAYVASEAAERVPGLERAIFALDPATDVSGGFNPQNPNEVNYRNEALYTWAFIDGNSSNFGSSLAASTAAQSFVVKGGDHSLYRMFRSMIDAPTNATSWFDIGRLDAPSPWESNQFDEFGSPSSAAARLHEGILNLNGDKITVQSSAYFPLGEQGRLSVRAPLTFGNGPQAAPVVASFGSNVAYREGAAPTLLTTTATVRDADSLNFDGGNLVVRITANGHADDRLSIRHQGFGAGQVGVNGTEVSFGGVVIGALVEGTGTSPLIVTFNDRATFAAAEAVLRNVTFQNISVRPTTATRTVQTLVSDGDGGTSTAVSKMITVTAVNNVPVIGAFDAPAAFVEAGGPVLLDEDATIADPDSADFASGKLTVRLAVNGNASDRLAIRQQGTGPGQVGVSGSNVLFGGVVVGTFSGGTGTTALTITFNARSSPAAAEAVLRNITFNNVSTAPTTAARTIQATLTDGDGGTSAVVSKTVTVAPVNTAPAIAAFDTTVTYRENAVPIVLDTNATAADPDSPNFNGGMLAVSLTLNGEANDRLAVRHQGNGAGQVGLNGAEVRFGSVLIGTLAGGIGTDPLVVTFNAQATAAAVQAVLRNVTFANASDAPVTAARHVDVTLTDDGGLASVVRSKTINVTAVNDAPAVAGFDTPVAYRAGGLPQSLDDDATVVDPDSPDFNGGRLTVQLVNNAQATDRLTIRNEGQIAASAGVVTFGGVPIGTFSGGTGSTALTITFNQNATREAVEALLRSIEFSSTSASPSLATRTVRVTLTDGDGGTSAAASKAINVTAI